ARWTAGRPPGAAGFVAALDAGRRGGAGAEAALRALLRDREVPGIARATALSLLPPSLTPEGRAAAAETLADPDPLVRPQAARAARRRARGARAVGAAGAEPVARLAERLRDPVRAVRIEAARALASTPEDRLPPDARSALDAALGELVASEEVSADRPESHLN